MQKTLLFIFFITTVLNANQTLFLSKKQIASLAQKQKWQELLYFDKENNQSEVLDESYFLAENGNENPSSELEATLQAYEVPFSQYKNPNDHPICRFPARYFWLNSEIGLANYSPINEHCTYLKKSFKKTKIDSVSLMFVTGYLGNPASSFGHSFLKLNTAENSDLFDLSISYGADVPKNENIFLYIYRGLFGKYSARFTDKYFYSHDLVYTGNEQRDIWEYKLHLSKEEVLFFRLHMWEILNKKFKYLFLNQNCGYEVAKTSSIMLKKPLPVSNKVWYAPIETFYALDDINKTKRIIDKVVYHPSAQKVLYERFKKLDSLQRNSVNKIIDDDIHFKSYLQRMDKADQIIILDFLIAYYNFMILKGEDIEKYKHLKYLGLLYRISLPIHKENELHFSTKSPSLNDKPSLFQLKYCLTNRFSSKTYVALTYAPYAIESIGNNNLNGDELVVFKLESALSKNSVHINRFDLINIWQFNKYPIPKITTGSFSWHLNIAYEALDIIHKDDYFFDASVGKSWYPNNNITLFMMANTSLHSYEYATVLAPEFGIRYAQSAVKFLAIYKREYDLYNKRFNINIMTVNANFNIKKNISYRLSYEQKDEKYRLTNGLQINF